MTQHRLDRGNATVQHSARTAIFARAAAVATVCGLAAVMTAQPPAAGTHPRAPRTHHTVALQPVQETAPAAAHTPAAAKKTAPKASGKPTATHSSKASAAHGKAAPHAKSRHHSKAQQDDAADPVEMKRVAMPRRAIRPAPVAPRHLTAAAAPAANVAAAPNQGLSNDDFLRAAGDMTMVTPVADTPIARVESDPIPAARKPAPQRIDGFGAEGAMLPARAAATPPPPALTLPRSALADPRVMALTHPSREDLTEEAAEPLVLPGLYRNGRLIVPAPLKGTHEILVHQNTMADQEGLERIQDDDDLDRLRASRQLVNFPESASLRVNGELAGDRRCARVWTVRFAADTARAFYARFHQPLQINSAVRTVAYQRRLLRINGNAAPIAGEVASPHLTGQAIDFAKRDMSIAEIAWMRAYLKPLISAGKVDVEEEFQQACFHISVYKSYLPPVRRVQVAQVEEVGSRK